MNNRNILDPKRINHVASFSIFATPHVQEQKVLLGII